MENLSHSFSKRSYGGNGFGTASHKSVYDDVFGGPPKFGMPTLAPRLEDYSEIFGGFHSARGSSIPILDLPVVDEGELCFDVRSSRFDYTEVFGGFGGLDFGLSLEDFVPKSDGRDESSDDDAWSPAESESPSGDTDPSAFSERSQSLINEDIYHPTTGIGQFDASLDEANQRSDEKMSNLTEAQLHAIPGNAYMLEENHILQKAEVQSSQGGSDHKSNTDFDGGTSEVKRTIFLPGNLDFRRQERDFSHVEKYRGPGPNQIKPFVTVKDINLKTKPSQLPPPSRPPPLYADKKGASAKLNLRPKASSNYSLEQTEGSSSLPFYDIEIDGSSSTFASLPKRDTKEKVQAKIRGARDSMDKKEILRSCSESQPQSSMKTVEENVNKTFESISSCKDDRKVKCTEGSGGTVPLAEEKNKLFTMDQEVSHLVAPERDIDFVERSTTGRDGKESRLSAQAFAWRQETEFFEVVEAGVPFEAVELHKAETKFVPKSSNEFRNWVVNEAFERKEEVMGFKEAKEVPKLHEKKNKIEVAVEAYGDEMRSETGRESSSQILFQKVATTGLKSCELDLNKKKIKMAKPTEEMRRPQNDSERSRDNQTKADLNVLDLNVLEANHKPREIRGKTGSKLMVNDSYAWKTTERKPKDDLVIEESDDRHSEADEQEEIKKTEIVRKKPDEYHEKQRNRSIHDEVIEKRSTELKEYGKNLEKSLEKNEDRRIQELDGSTITFVEFDIEESSTITSVSTDSTPIEACEHQGFGGCANDAKQIKGDCKGGTGKLDQATHPTIENERIKAFDETDMLNNDRNGAPLSGELDIGSGKVETYQASISCEEDEDLKTNLEESEHGIDARVTDCLVDESLHSANEDEFQHAVSEKGGTLGVMNNENDSIEAGMDIGNSSIKLDKEVSKRSSEPHHTKVKAYEQGQRVKRTSGVQLDFYPGISKDNFTSHQPFVELSENGKVTGASLTAILGDGEIHLNSGKNCIQNVDEKNMNETLSVENNEIEERLQKERELEMEHLRKIEEEREREREREKDRMAIDRATLEARDRLHIDARERASVERAAAEVRQRAMAEAREKMEKSSLEARERYLADKASAEARLRAERAAVERATLEARQRAFEKAMADRVMAGGRERVERSVSDKFFTSSRTDELRQNSFSNTGTSNALRYSYSSVHIGNESESPQRCKARLERYRRTAERAAKALEEKNLRDLVAQREQAERNRLAETLDADVKRWSSGKEGNLRALLSTLQYILGPETGWHPIPLTEVITSAAVKKAYRKATLCVHPDKLQQRGASIQQKYICEKVFDLLKEAWNTFNSEER